MTNRLLHQAKDNKKDEFYTQLVDIEKELKYYKNHFKDKVVFCNCDDPFESNFVKYFALNFNYLGIKKLIATCYATSPVAWGQLSLFDVNTFEENLYDGRLPYKIEISEVKDFNNDGATDLFDIEYLLKNEKNTLTILKSDGDFRSEESIELLQQSDIVVTNPPFSLFREFVAQLIEYDKKFIIIGNINSIGTKNIFPLVMQNLIWLGQSITSGDREFRVPDSYPLKSSGFRIDDEGNKYIRVKGVRWYTNLDVPKRNEKIVLYKKYSEIEYPKYDNYDAIEVSKTKEIPLDYSGVMGVPITFIDKYNPQQFEILGVCENLDLYGLKTKVYTSQECRDRYFEIFGKKGTYDLNASGVVNGFKVYQRILIRNKEVED